MGRLKKKDTNKDDKTKDKGKNIDTTSQAPLAPPTRPF